MDALAADFCPPKKTIVETIAAAPSRLARFCFSFSLSSEDDSDEDATIEKDFFSLLFGDDLMKILLVDDEPSRGFCSRLDDDRIFVLIHLDVSDEEDEEEEEPTQAKADAALPLIIAAFIAWTLVTVVLIRERESLKSLFVPFFPPLGF